VTASLAFRKHESAILRGDVPAKYLRILPHVVGHRVLEIGSAEGVLALLLAKQGKDVIALERSQERHETAQVLRDAWGMDVTGPRFICGDIKDNLGRLEGIDTLLAVRMVYYLGDSLDTVFAEVAKHVPNVVLCGNGNRANRWRMREPDDGAENFYASLEGMTSLLMRHGYSIAGQVCDGDQIVIGRK
jgi:hypothetical protein